MQDMLLLCHKKLKDFLFITKKKKLALWKLLWHPAVKNGNLQKKWFRKLNFTSAFWDVLYEATFKNFARLSEAAFMWMPLLSCLMKCRVEKLVSLIKLCLGVSGKSLTGIVFIPNMICLGDVCDISTAKGTLKMRIIYTVLITSCNTNKATLAKPEKNRNINTTFKVPH